MSTSAKDMINDLLLAADGEDDRECYGHEGGVIESGSERAMATLINIKTKEKFRITVQRVG